MRNFFEIHLCNFCLAIVLMLSQVTMNAQPYIDILNVKYQYFPQHPYSDTSNGKLGGNLREAAAIFPIVLKSKSVILIGGIYRQINFIASGDLDAKVKLYSILIPFGYKHQWKNEKWRTLVLAIPKMNSDLIEANSLNYQFGGVLLFHYVFKKELIFHLGGYYNTEKFGGYFIPLAGIEWKINDRLNLFGDLPNNMTFEYKLNKKFYCGLAYFSYLSTFSLTGSTENYYVREGDKRSGHSQGKIFLNWYVVKNFVFYMEGGVTFKRIFHVYDSNNNEVNDLNSVFREAGDGIFFTSGFAYRIRLD